MKEEELLLYKEELAKIKASRIGLLVLGILITILGIITSLIYIEAEAYKVATGTGTFAFLESIIIVSFVLTIICFSLGIVIICCIIAGFVYERDYQDNLKELIERYMLK